VLPKFINNFSAVWIVVKFVKNDIGLCLKNVLQIGVANSSVVYTKKIALRSFPEAIQTHHALKCPMRLALASRDHTDCSRSTHKTSKKNQNHEHVHTTHQPSTRISFIAIAQILKEARKKSPNRTNTTAKKLKHHTLRFGEP
jgi:hypothetical protein